MNQKSNHLLIIEDDHVLREGLALALSSDSLNVHMASSIEEAWREIHSTSPDILLLDEPFSALDYHTRLGISDEISEILKNENKTALMITHDIAEAISMGDRVIILTKRPAGIKEILDISLTCPDGENTPLKCREAPEFRHYFNKIWKELDVHVE